MRKIVKNNWAFIAFSVKAVTGLLGGSLVLSNEHPFTSLAVLGIGAIVNEAIDFFELKK